MKFAFLRVVDYGSDGPSSASVCTLVTKRADTALNEGNVALHASRKVPSRAAAFTDKHKISVHWLVILNVY